MEPQTLPSCPQCKQTDQVQKVTATYGANTEEWIETTPGRHGSHRTHHEAHTSLGLELQPPAQPTGPVNPAIWYAIVGVVVFFLVSTVLCPIATIPLFLLIPLAGTTSYIPSIQWMPSWEVLAAVIGGVVLCVGVIGVGVIAWLAVIVKRRFDRDLSNYKSKKAIYDEEELPRWQRAKDRWEQLYYCMRDDTVFIPAENRAIHAVDMEKYLYDPFFRG